LLSEDDVDCVGGAGPRHSALFVGAVSGGTTESRDAAIQGAFQGVAVTAGRTLGRPQMLIAVACS